MKQKVIEPVLGICLLAMVVMAVKYGSIRVTGSGDAYIKETPVVVVDAGHGGTDPGKVGVDGSLEKDINLAVAERLKTYLEQDDVKVIMTRETDTGLYSETDSRKKMADMKKRCEIIERRGPCGQHPPEQLSRGIRLWRTGILLPGFVKGKGAGEDPAGPV